MSFQDRGVNQWSGHGDGANAWVVEQLCQVFHRLDEGIITCCHEEVDGVEVAIAMEAPTQIGFWIDDAAEL